MFQWYKKAKICLAYLEDVTSGPEFDQSFRTSVWFTRSWTLQELLAPRLVDFFDHDWNHIGSKRSNLEAISAITKISEAALAAEAGDLWHWSIAEKLSWASDRKATRSEDIAYSLMGIFDVNMPLLYGEGKKAFTRLQEEIIRSANEPTFLLWGLENPTNQLLASSPTDFYETREMEVYCTSKNISFGLTNLGLEIEAEITRWQLGIYGIRIAAAGPESNTFLFVLLVEKHPDIDAYCRTGVGRYRDRTDSNGLGPLFETRKLHLLRGSQAQELEEEGVTGYSIADHGYEIRNETSLQISLVDDSGEKISDSSSRLTCKFGMPIFADVARIACRIGQSLTLWMDLSFDFDSNPCVLIGKSKPTLQLYSRLGGPLWKLSHVFKDACKEKSPDDYWDREYEMMKLRDELTHEAFYFLFNPRESSIHFKLPANLAPAECPIWMSFNYPPIRAKGPRFWGFVLSVEKLEWYDR